MAFQSEQKIKTQILTCLGPDQLFRLLSDSDIQILMKTLGLLRNLLSNKPVSCNLNISLFDRTLVSLFILNVTSIKGILKIVSDGGGS